MTLTRTMLNRLIAQARVLGVMGRRDRLIFETLYATRITLAELTRLRRYDVDMLRHRMHIRGRRARTFKIDPTLCSRLTFYRDAVIGYLMSDGARDVLFPYEHAVPFTVTRLRALIEHYRRAAGIEKYDA
jgi:site-specific recombinase XerD